LKHKLIQINHRIYNEWFHDYCWEFCAGRRRTWCH